MKDTKERTIGSIQRDRLSEFVKVAETKDTGCFYFALLMSFNHIFPEEVIEREFLAGIMRRRERLSVMPAEVITEVKLSEQHLKLRVEKIGITNQLNESIDDFRVHAKIPQRMPVARETLPSEWANPRRSAVIVWMNKWRLHYTSAHPNTRFSQEEIAPYHPEFAPVAIFHLTAIDSGQD